MESGCMSSRSNLVADAPEAEVKKRNLDKKVCVNRVGCLCACSQGPMVACAEGGNSVATGTKCLRASHPKTPPPCSTRWAAQRPTGSISPSTNPSSPAKNASYENLPAPSTPKISKNPSAPAPMLHYSKPSPKCPRRGHPGNLTSGLRGRGGAGYPTGLKWATVAKAARRKYVICNADEGDPGAFMDRSVLESDPHRVLEGMAIAAYAVGAHHGYIYVRAEYPLAIKRLKTAIKQAKRLGLLGNGIFGTPFDFDIDMRIGAGAFVCGEETALLRSKASAAPAPPTPPFPATACGIARRSSTTSKPSPTSPPIIRNGAEWFAGIGTEKSKGTKVFALAGKISNTGLVEVPMGITAARDRRRDRRRRPRRQQDQGRADRRPLRRLHPRRAARHARRLRIARQASAPSWAPAA